MTDKSNYPNWAEGVPAPVDRNGNVVPLATRKLYDETGQKVEVREIAIVNSKLRRGLVWHVRTPSGVVLALDRVRLDPPDSWEWLLVDLDRAADTSGNNNACSYLTGYASTRCRECSSYEKNKWCNQTMLADIARRIRELRKADENAD